VRALVAVLAGGRSRRMGAPKAAVSFRGAPLIARPLAAAHAAGLPAVVVAKPGFALPAGVSAPVWEEPEAPVHPLCGIVAALERAGGPVVVVACDQPWVPAALLRALADAEAPLVVCDAGRLEPFPGRYSPELTDGLRAALVAEAPLRATLAGLAPGRLDLRRFGDPTGLTASLNTPAALAAAERSGTASD
jgi:molybdenum cofactor guanylyltransferase